MVMKALENLSRLKRIFLDGGVYELLKKRKDYFNPCTFLT